WRGIDLLGDSGQRRCLQRGETAEREEGYIGNTCGSQRSNQSFVPAVYEVVLILHADDVCDGTSFLDLLCRHVAEADVTDEPLPLQLCQCGEWRLDRALSGCVNVEHQPEVDDIQDIQPQIAQV